MTGGRSAVRGPRWLDHCLESTSFDVALVCFDRREGGGENNVEHTSTFYGSIEISLV